MKNTKRLLLVILSILLIVCTIAPTTLAVGLDIDSIESSFTTGEDEERTVVATTEEEDVTCTITGNIPQNVEAAVTNVDVADVPGIDDEDIVVPEDAVAVDISMSNKFWGTEWQPDEGKPVAVTMAAEKFGEEGDVVSLYHVHENEDGSVSTELMGPYTIENGKIAFEMSSFSYIIIFPPENELIIEGVKVYFPARLPSGNGNFEFVGVYYDSNDHAHFLIGVVQNNWKNASKAQRITFYDANNVFHDITVVKEGSEKNTEMVEGNYDEVIVRDETNHDTTYTVKGGIGIIDVDLGENILLPETFLFSLYCQGGGWSIIGVEAEVLIEYSIKKLVASGGLISGDFSESVTVSPGEMVTYKITVANSEEATITLDQLTVMDILPSDLFEEDSVELGIVGNDGSVQEWTKVSGSEIELFKGQTYEPGDSHDIYLRARVRNLDDLGIKQDKTYPNVATIDGYNKPQLSAEADVTVKVPQSGELTVSKAVETENILDPIDPDQEFVFKIESDADKDSFDYTKNGVAYKVVNGGTFTLKNGESIVFHNFPTGEFSIKEMETAGFVTTVNGVSGGTFMGEMATGDKPIVNFHNLKSTRFDGYSVYYVEKDNEENILKMVSGSAAVGETIVIPKEVFEGYSYDSQTAESITIVHGEDNVAYVYYVRNEYTITYIVDGQQVHQDAYKYQDAVVPYEASEKPGYVFDGWYSDATYETEVSIPGTMPAENIIVYGRYIRLHDSLTITKTGVQDIDESQTFIFLVKGVAGDPDTSEIELTVTVHGNGSTTIEHLPIGDYTVTEITSWSFRYTPDATVKTKTLVYEADNELVFNNTRASKDDSNSHWKWLNGDNFMVNHFVTN